ncbi:zinc finger protein-domain-containing protein [Cryomyces antarcticus]|uniref:DUF3669 domain-containing protein n=1 Tax=Cryomyces antarcticus TaxID=329879 RepID=A0ABR0KV12_9PEZI|nr:hypothetical protein LTR39_000013 [Cryomyces antarcticus]KAK5021393.1 hypothetical protein LTR60_000009 [Cryomyces antarcticus]KAK5132133.1 hypothetical protein LTR16_000013 [Cryomyces antarcticus]
MASGEDSFGKVSRLPKANEISRHRATSPSVDVTPISSRSSSLENVEATAKNTLRRLLSIRSAISTTPSYATKNQAAQGHTGQQCLREIGRGTCGTVFRKIGTDYVYKRAHCVGKGDDQLWNDCQQHFAIVQSFESAGVREPRIPRFISFITAADWEWWEENEAFFPESERKPADLLVTGRIMPVPEKVRKALISVYSEELDLETERLAIEMADALAVLHWVAKCDGNDVEFVLGSQPAPLDFYPMKASRLPSEKTSLLKQTTSPLDFQRRVISLWLLDFNRCKPIDVDVSGAAQASRMFLANDPYYPRPHGKTSGEQKLWRVFKDRYLMKSYEVMGASDGRLELPAAVIEGIVRLHREHLESIAELESGVAGWEHEDQGDGRRRRRSTAQY